MRGRGSAGRGRGLPMRGRGLNRLEALLRQQTETLQETQTPERRRK